jgi:hypothetical protein
LKLLVFLERSENKEGGWKIEFQILKEKKKKKGAFLSHAQPLLPCFFSFLLFLPSCLRDTGRPNERKSTCSELTEETKSPKSDEFHQNCVCNELVSATGNLVSAEMARLFC